MLEVSFCFKLIKQKLTEPEYIELLFVYAPQLVGDISYIPTQEGWLYVSTVIDLYSRKVVGWSMSDRLKAELVNNALLMAIWKRKPSKGLIWHTDQGSQYASHSHRKILKQH